MALLTVIQRSGQICGIVPRRCLCSTASCRAVFCRHIVTIGVVALDDASGTGDRRSSAASGNSQASKSDLRRRVGQMWGSHHIGHDCMAGTTMDLIRVVAAGLEVLLVYTTPSRNPGVAGGIDVSTTRRIFG